MKKLLVAIGIFALLSGCSTTQKVFVITQEIAGSGSVTVESPLQVTSAVVQGARQEGGAFVADRFDLIYRGKWSKIKIDLHFENYSRPLIEPEN